MRVKKTMHIHYEHMHIHNEDMHIHNKDMHIHNEDMHIHNNLCSFISVKIHGLTSAPLAIMTPAAPEFSK